MTPVTITGRREYHLTVPRYAGDLADLYPVGDGELLKLPRDPANSDLLDREAETLRRLADRADPRYLPYLPRLTDSFRHRDDGTGAARRITVLGAATGLRSLAEVRAAYPDGLDPRDAAWIWRRLLVALGAAHRAGVVHGAVLPDHVLIQPEEHGLVLVDWCYASLDGAPVPALVPAYADWYPAEIRQRRRPGPGSDIALATVSIAWLIGDRAPAPMRRFVAGCLLDPLARRPDDAWRLLAELDDLLEELYGPRVFRPLPMPPRTRPTAHRTKEK